MVKGKTGWSFDIAAGEKEILARRVGQNELDVIQVCIGYVEAQRDYLTRNPDGASRPSLRGPAPQLARKARWPVLAVGSGRAGEPDGARR